MNYKLPTRDVTANLIMDVVSRCSHSNADIDSLIQYTGRTKLYITGAIEAGCMLNMLEIQTNGTWKTVKDCTEILKHPSSQELKLAIFTRWLQMWNPFILFLKYLQIGDDTSVAARRLCSFYSFNKNHEGVSKQLALWGKNCKLLNNKGKLTSSIQLKEQEKLLNNISEDLIDDARARMYLVEKLGEDVFNWLQADEIQELINGFIKCQQHPQDAVIATGRALEDVLKRVYIDLLGFDAQDLVKKNTITQLGQCLRNKESIHAKHTNIILGQASIRNMGSHGKELDSMEKWEITSTAAIGKLFSTLALIKSLFLYVRHGELSY